jgi:uncharacterized protein with HEPN domain
MRDYKFYLEDIQSSIQKIGKFTKGLSLQKFQKDDLVIDAVIRNLAVIGEASKSIPDKIKKKYPNIEWEKIAALRNILVHEYFGIDEQIVWDIITNKLPELKKTISTALKAVPPLS